VFTLCAGICFAGADVQRAGMPGTCVYLALFMAWPSRKPWPARSPCFIYLQFVLFSPNCFYFRL